MLMLLAAAMFALASPASALVFTGTIESQYDDQGNWIASTVDYWSFTVESAGIVTLDVLSAELNYQGQQLDVNQDGEIAFIDSKLFLFRNDGTLGIDDYITENDDMDALGVDGDGSFETLDSFLELSLDTGSYIVAIGTYEFSVEEAIAGLNQTDDYGPNSLYGSGWESPISHGDYQLSVTTPGETAPVPEPGTMVLLGIGMLGIVGVRRKLLK